MKYIKNLFNSTFLGFGISVFFLLLLEPILNSGKILKLKINLINYETILSIFILIFLLCIGSNFIFYRQACDKKQLWIKRIFVIIYACILSNLFIYFYIKNLKPDISSIGIKTFLFLTFNIIIISVAIYIIADIIENKYIKRINRSLREYNKDCD